MRAQQSHLGAHLLTKAMVVQSDWQLGSPSYSRIDGSSQKAGCRRAIRKAMAGKKSLGPKVREGNWGLLSEKQ